MRDLIRVLFTAIKNAWNHKAIFITWNDVDLKIVINGKIIFHKEYKK